jgi:PAS domain S-box-containing protein
VTEERAGFATGESIELFLEAAPDAIVVVDHQGRILAVNGLTEKMFGYAPGELIGRLVEVLVPRRFHDVHVRERGAYSERPKTRAMGAGQELLGTRADGSEFPVQISLSPFQTENGPCIISIIRDVTALKQAEEKFRGLLESAPDAIIVVDDSGRIVIVNSQTEAMFGYRRDELLGNAVELLVPDQFRPRHSGDRARYAAAPRTRPMGAGRTLSGRRRDGTEIPVEISLSPLQTEQGLLVMSIIRDVTDRLRVEEERRTLIAAQIRAAETSRAKDQFLMTLSHELRTPLTAILGWAKLVAHEDDIEVLREALQIIERSAEAQARIIDDVLEMSRMIAGKVDLEVEITDPILVVHSVLQTLRPSASAKRIRLNAEIAPDVAPIPADPARLQQIVWNLVSNAIKFSAKESMITLKLEKHDSDLEISVTDSGEGIAAEALPYVFEPFFQADGSTTRVHGGLGLGLSVVRQLVELHGGQIFVESRGRGHGATFRVRLPIRATAAEERAADRDGGHPSSFSDLSGRRILYVDDDEESRNLVSAVLARAKAMVRSEASVANALAALSEWQPDAIVTDLAMPEEDGYSLARTVRQMAGSLPVIALSAMTRIDEKEAALFDAFIRKPAEPVAIARAVFDAIERRNRPA